MSAFSFLLNLLWILFGGLWMAAGWVIAAIFMAITIIGLPWTRAAFNIAAYTLLPFGQKVVSRAVYFGREDIGTGQKKASRLELSVRRLAASAAKGDIGSAAWLLKLRAHAEKYRDAGPSKAAIRALTWWPRRIVFEL
jgi:hypothetical protein